MQEQFFSSFEVARMCHVSPSSVIRWIREGRLKAAVTVGGHHRIRSADLIALLQSLRMPIPEKLCASSVIKVLIVEDEVSLSRMIKVNLEKHFEGIEVEEATEGFRAGWKAFGFRPDIIILDVLLPGMDGFQVLEFIRTNEKLKDTKVISITAMDNEETKTRLMDLGADEFLAKPFEFEQLRLRITKLLDGNQNGTKAA